jgi:hypothetical protein
MNQDYEKPLLWRNLFRLRWFNPAWTAKSLSEYLNSQFLKDMTFQNVRERESSGDIPHQHDVVQRRPSLRHHDPAT